VRFVAAMMRTSTCCVPTEPTGSKPSVLEDAQELHLQLRAHLSDLVEKDGAAVGELEATDARGDRARERATFMTEHLALEQLFRDRAAVHRHESSRGTA
jgi:hypothetical protein